MGHASGSRRTRHAVADSPCAPILRPRSALACALPRRFPFNLLPPGLRFDVCLHREATPCVVCSCARARSVWQLATPPHHLAFARPVDRLAALVVRREHGMAWADGASWRAGAFPCPCIDRDGMGTTREQSPAASSYPILPTVRWRRPPSPPSDAPRVLLVVLVWWQ